jgi:hypothetical protein
VILAGKWFRWNTGFRRHPRCDCIHIPSAENMAGDFRTDPYEYFHSLSKSEQDGVFGKSGAQAIRDGADIYKTVNLNGVTVTNAGVRSRSIGRVTVADIYKAAHTREEAISLLERNGFILPRGQVVAQRAERFAGMTSTPRPGSARERVLAARRSGVRDPLDRSTMTAAERRLFDANYRLEYARQNGYLPRSIGPNSADAAAGTRGLLATPERIAELEAELQKQLGAIQPRQTSMIRLVNELGLNDDRSAVVFGQIEAVMQARFTTATRLRNAPR